MTAVPHSVSGVQTEYHGCFWTHRNVTVWKPKQMRICVSTENNRDPEISPDGGRRGTSSFHAGFRLTEKDKGQEVKTQVKKSKCGTHNLGVIYIACIYIVTPLLLTGKDNKEDDGDIDEEELEVSQVTEDLKNKDNRQFRSDTAERSLDVLLIQLLI